MKTLLSSIAIIAVLCWFGNRQVLPTQVSVSRETITIDTGYNLQDLACAIAEIESNHNPKARRFEAHLFERMTGIRYATLAQAQRINWNAAMLATSHGKYQILGSNYKACGFQSLREFVTLDERGQDVAFMRYALRNRLDTLTRQSQWKRIARIYNGRNFRRNSYDKKLEKLMKRKKTA